LKFINLNDETVRGLVQITDFVDSGDMTPDLYPDIGSPIAAVVVGYTEDDSEALTCQFAIKSGSASNPAFYKKP
jgi:hypothetical protein